jgi:hypothetical protein
MRGGERIANQRERDLIGTMGAKGNRTVAAGEAARLWLLLTGRRPQEKSATADRAASLTLLKVPC